MEKQPAIKYNTLDRNGPIDVQQSRTPIHLVLDNIRSAFNVGSAFRTGDAVMVEKIYLTGITAAPNNPKIEKTALTSTLSVPWQHYDTTAQAIDELKAKKIPICVVELTSASVNFWHYQFPMPLALVVGNELEGVSNEAIAAADACIYIPMYGRKSTLNVSTSLGVALFEALRQWELRK